MSGASAALEVLRKAGLKVSPSRTKSAAQEEKQSTLATRFGMVDLITTDDGKFVCTMYFDDKDQPMVILETTWQQPLTQRYALSSFILCLAQGRDFHAQMFDGDPCERISLRDVARITERAMSLLPGYGEFEIKFTEHDYSIPF
jgi:hypothetical protein